jgi:hypothetical protein
VREPHNRIVRPLQQMQCFQRVRVHDTRRARRLVVAFVIGVCAWDDSSDLAWTDPAPHVVTAHAAAAPRAHS